MQNKCLFTSEKNNAEFIFLQFAGGNLHKYDHVNPYVTSATSRHFSDKVHQNWQNEMNDNRSKRHTRWRLSFADTGIPVNCRNIKQFRQQNK